MGSADAKGSTYRGGDARTERVLRMAGLRQRRGRQAGDTADGTQRGLRFRPGQPTGQFELDGGPHRRRVLAAEQRIVQQQPLDVQFDPHALPPALSSQRKSASLTGLSSLRNSARAASSSSGMPICTPALAARKAALTAMPWMLPPLSASRASRSRSNAPTFACAGNTEAQIARRSATPGNGKLTTKRSRRRNALSSAPFWLVARIARPRNDSSRRSEEHTSELQS